MKKGERIRTTEEMGQQDKWEILGLAGKRSSKKWSDSYNVKNLRTGEVEWIDLRDFDEVEKINDDEEILLCFEDKDIADAKRKEIESWKNNQVYIEEDDRGEKSISTRWIITEKYKEGKKICKARLIARGFEEQEEDNKKDAPTCAAETLKICLGIMNMKGWCCRSLDIKTAYLQGDKIDRTVYVQPPIESGYNGLWKLQKTVYGLKDAAMAWYRKVMKVVKELNGHKCRLDPTIFYWKTNGMLDGIMCTHVDDFCFGGTSVFQKKVIDALKKTLKVGEEEISAFKYIGVNIQQEGNTLWLDQQKYIDGIKIPEERRYKEKRMLDRKEMKLYRSLIGQMNWVSQHTRPDMSFDVSDLSGACKGASTDDTVKLIKVIKHLKYRSGKIGMDKINEKQIKWEVYADASFGNVDDEKSQLGYIISIADENNKRCPLYWKSQRAKRVAKSTIEAEALSVGEAAEAAIYLKKIWDEIVGTSGGITINTDSKTLEKAITSTSGVKSKRLRIDIAAIKEMIETSEIQEIKWIRTQEQIADILTKRGVHDQVIREYVFEEKRKKKKEEK